MASRCKRTVGTFTLLLGLALSSSGWASSDLIINGTRLPAKSIALLEKALTRVKFNTDLSQVRQGVVDNHVLAQAVAGDLSAANQASLAVDLELESADLLERVLGKQLERDFQPYLSAPQPMTSAQLAALLQPRAGLVALDSLWLDQSQRADVAQATLVTWQFPQQPAHALSLLEVWDSVAVQGKVELQKGNLQYLGQQVAQHLQRAFYWYQLKDLGYSQAEIDGIRTLVRDKLVRHKYMHQLGLHSDFHHETPVLKAMAAKVSDAEAKDYYQAHQAEFMNVAQVQAAHIRLDSQAKADAVYAEIEQGLPFAEAVRQYSLAQDKEQDPPGDLGLVRHDDPNLSFLHKTALIQKADSVSQPMWLDGFFEIVQVRSRQDRLLPLSDPSVRREVNQQVARIKLAQQVETQLATLRANAKVQGL
ncbi:peptidylprolyl isomerase [Atopomonas sediminilitoris]|uniref:peptidylprolyl isomerase n=1 Tax=Atopomonas sediminilitoris TaxID=2919919 RepID=UPI001F4EE9F2|nr:peptidyl-prolyl cis-trans isomerase [Atopomonas sediminilitoris]MCJ8169356.1 peptidyl-prolyl cis-trans isomerase [Atopomonas sediminilitoris]